MKTNELRIGNYVKRTLPTDMAYAKVLEITHNGLLVQDKDGYVGCSMNFIEPIELTEEVLVKIGFVKENEINRMYNNRCVVSYYIGNFYKELVIEVRRENGFYKNNMVHYDIKYLHELQNAYYCLTGQELEVEL